MSTSRRDLNDNYVNKLVTGLTAVGDAGSRNIITFASRARLPRTTASGLPTGSSAVEGFQFEVTDATATTYRSVVAGGGSNRVVVTCLNGSWLITG